MRPTRVAGFGLSLALTLAASLSATVYTVTTNADSGAGSLRQAITDANGAAGPHTIAFNITGTGPHSIVLATDLPTIVIVEGLTIDGTTQPGFAGTPEIEIARDGSFSSSCFAFSFTPATIKALAINRCGNPISATNGGALTIKGCRLGTDPSGTVVLPNGNGITITNGVSNNVIGGAAASDRNILSNHQGYAVSFSVNSSGTVRGNSIGVDATGTVAMPNAVGINCLNGAGLVIGGSAAGEGNLISGNTGNGITLGTCNNAVIQGNLFGTDVTGTLAIPNGKGIEVNVSNNVVIGGAGAGEGNVVAGNIQEGIRLTVTNGAVVRGNFIGTDASGTLRLGNAAGINLNSNTGTLVGPATPGGPGVNVIAYNTFGVVNTGSGNSVRGNSIHDSTFLGMDIGNNGVTSNDPIDADNGQPNFPNIASAVPEGGGVRIIGELDSNPASNFDLDFYENPGCSRFPQDYLEGPKWLGTSPVTTDGSGHASFNVLLSPVAVAPDLRVTATSTGAEGTSEFSQRIVLASAPLGGNTGGSPLQIQGMQFENGATVTVGGVPATNVQWTSDTFLTATAPALPAGSINDIVVTNPSGLSGTLPHGYVSNFADVDPGSLFRPFIAGLVANGLTVGCGGPNYCPVDPVTRQQMAVFLLRGKYGLCYTPPPCTGTVFDDVPCTGGSFDPWIEALAGLSITSGCGGGNNYCPTTPVNRQQMAVFLLKALEGSDYAPPACTNPTFTDVPCASPFATWIYELAQRQITGGCGGTEYCPTSPAIRQQMAAFLVKTFSLPY
jgi:hypothetical protein